jgi:subtilisin family serine protease
MIWGTGVVAAMPSGLDGGSTARIAPEIAAWLDEANAEDMRSVIVTLREQADLSTVRGRTRAERLRQVIDRLHATAEREQPALLGLLAHRAAEGSVADVTAYWIFDGLAVTATPRVLRELAARPEVASISPDAAIVAPAGPLPTTAAPEWNIERVGAPRLWDLGFTGEGVVVATMDTGVDVTHPDLAGSWRGGSNSWFDPNGQHPTFPVDVNGHGTWTMSVMVGGSAGGTAIGMAPGARWISVKIFDDAGVATSSDIHAGFQWLLDPDGDPATPDAPHVVSDSWTMASPGCDLSFQLDLRALRAAGILPVFAAGNFGPGSGTSASPANYPEAFAVGATDAGDAIASMSSRGPSACGEATTTFPDLVAPGVHVRTADLFGTYATPTGTSIAAPHVAGALALLLDAYPGLSADLQAQALEMGAMDLGPAGPDDTFGWGRLDVGTSYAWLASRSQSPPETPPDFALAISPTSADVRRGGSVAFTISVLSLGGFSGPVGLSVSGLPPRTTASLASSSVIAPGSTTLTVSTRKRTSRGTYTLTVTGSAGSLAHEIGATLVVR